MIQINCQIIKFHFLENRIWDRKKVLSYFISQRAKHLLQRSPLKEGIPRQECMEYNPLDMCISTQFCGDTYTTSNQYNSSSIFQQKILQLACKLAAFTGDFSSVASVSLETGHKMYCVVVQLRHHSSNA